MTDSAEPRLVRGTENGRARPRALLDMFRLPSRQDPWLHDTEVLATPGVGDGAFCASRARSPNETTPESEGRGRNLLIP
jgi:hypothetical protein